jgi:hypothetical protein
MNRAMSPVDAQLLFMHIDKDRSGTVEMAELIPVVFNLASPEQHALMHRVILTENAKVELQHPAAVAVAAESHPHRGFGLTSSL